MASKLIKAEMKHDTVTPYSKGPFPFIPMVVESNHPRFRVGTRLDWGFVSVSLQDGYDVHIKAPSNERIAEAIAVYEGEHGKQDWIDWRPKAEGR